MLKFAFALLALLATHSTASATNITPTEKLGRLKLAADVSKAPKYFVDGLTVKFNVGGKAAKVSLDKENVVAAGEGCLTVSNDRDYSYFSEQCGIVIQEKQLTTVQLSAVTLQWDAKLFAIDVGPSPYLSFSTKTPNMRLSGSLYPLNPPHQNPFLLTPMLTADVAVTHEETGSLSTQAVVFDGVKTESKDLRLADLRGTLFFDFVDGAPKFEVPAYNFVVATYERTIRSADRSRVPSEFRRTSDSTIGAIGRPEHNYNAYAFGLTGVSKKLRAFPIAPIDPASLAHYTISVNEHAVYPVFKSGQTVRIPIATFNVTHYKSSVPGTFKVFSNKDDSKTLAEAKFPYEYSDGTSQTSFKTESSLFFPLGYLYRLDFYVVDDLGRQSLQDQVTVDLTK